VISATSLVNEPTPIVLLQAGYNAQVRT